MQLKTTVQITVVDIITARVVARRRFLSRSYVLQFLDGLYDHMTQTTHNIRDVTNALRSVTPFTWYMNANAVDDDDDFGLVVGTGETAVALADYKLETKIVHGVGAGQLDYQAAGKTAPVTINGKRRFLLTRSFVNGSGNPITVNECGIYVRCTTTPYYFCIVRDIIEGGQAVPDTTTLTIQYEIAIQV